MWLPRGAFDQTSYWSIGRGGDRIGYMGTEAVLRALAEPNRQAILKLVRDKPRSVGEIGEHFDISQQAVSQHLQILTDAGLLDVEQQGKRRLYVVNPDGLEVLEKFLADLWPAGLRRLKKAVESHRGR
jgi:DNA-binding transcriptional ArsR family regulator